MLRDILRRTVAGCGGSRPGRRPGRLPAVLRLALLAALSSCTSMEKRVRLPAPTSPTNGLIVATVNLKSGWFQRYLPYEMEFARLLPDGKMEESPVVTNFRSGTNVYLLDVVPGKYVPIRVSYKRQNTVRHIPVPKLEQPRLEVRVRPGEAVFAGRYDFIPRYGWKRVAELDETDVKPEAEIPAMEAALKHLKGTLWIDALARRAAELGHSAAPVTEGGKEVMRQEKGKFSYVDSLGWGAPKSVRGGLEWREPKDRVRIAVLFLTEDMEGYKTGPEYLRHLRAVGSPEDDHKVTEVPFSRRTGHRATYTTHYYSKDTLLGSEEEVFVTETLMVAEPEGLFLLHYRAKKPFFQRFYQPFATFRKRILLRPDQPLKPEAAP